MARKKVGQTKAQLRGEPRAIMDAMRSVYSLATQTREEIIGDIAELDLDDNSLHRLSITLARLIEIQTILREYLPDEEGLHHDVMK